MFFFKYLRMEYWRLLLFGIHIGHSFKNSILFASWFIFTYRQNILIMNMYKTILGFKNGFNGFNYCIKFAHPIWFVNVERSTEIFIRSSAKQCGEFAYTTFWIHGMITNFPYINNSIGKLQRYYREAWKGTFRKLEFDWVYSRWSWPRSVLLCSVRYNKWPSNECTVSITSCLGIVDTNTSGNDTNIPAAGNDDSNDSIVFYNAYFSKYIIEKKYSSVISWLNNVKKTRRIIAFKQWLMFNFLNRRNEIDIKKILLYKQSIDQKYGMEKNLYKFINYRFKFFKFMKEGVLSFFSSNKANKQYYECLDIYEPLNLNIETRDLRRIMEKQIMYICKVFTFYVCRAAWRYYFYIRKKNLSNKIFQTRHSRGFYLKKVWRRDNKDNTNFIKNRYRLNRFYKTFLRHRKFRRNKFVLRFLKLYYFNKYLNNLGFIKFYNSIFIHLSSFFHISNTVYSHKYKKSFFKNLNNNNYFNKINKFIKYGKLYKWLFLKKHILLFLKKLIYNKTVKNEIKFIYVYRSFIALKNSLKVYIRGFFTFFNFYFLFWYQNRKQFRKYNKIKQLKKISKFKMFFYSVRWSNQVNIFYKSIFFKEKFKLFFLNYNKIKPYNLTKSFSKYFKVVNLIFKRKIVRIPKNWRFSLASKVKKYFNKWKRYSNKRQETIDVILHGLIRKYNRIKEDKKEQALSYIKDFRANIYIQKSLFRLKNNIIKKFKYMKDSDTIENFYNSITIKRFILLFRRNNIIKRLHKWIQFKFKREHTMNFNIISKKFYNYDIIFDKTNYFKLLNNLKKNIYLYKNILPYNILSKYMYLYKIKKKKKVIIEDFLKYELLENKKQVVKNFYESNFNYYNNNNYLKLLSKIKKKK
jgi:ribosomal protein S2